MNKFLIISIASLLNLDNTSAFQFLISRPSFVALILGYLSGFVVDGFLIGILFELVILDFTPVGGITIPNGTVAVAISVIMLDKADPYFSFFVGLLSGEIYSIIEKYFRKFNSYYNIILDKKISNYNFNFGGLIIISLLSEWLLCFIYIYVFYLAFSSIVPFFSKQYFVNVFRLSMASTVFITLTSLYFKFKTQVLKND